VGSSAAEHERSNGFKVMRKNEVTQLKKQETEKVDTPTGLRQDAVAEISGGLRQLLADVFVLYLKTKNFFHVEGLRLS
jgi:starvation-inducible DNA-binding protein